MKRSEAISYIANRIVVEEQWAQHLLDDIHNTIDSSECLQLSMLYHEHVAKIEAYRMSQRIIAEIDDERYL